MSPRFQRRVSGAALHRPSRLLRWSRWLAACGLGGGILLYASLFLYHRQSENCRIAVLMYHEIVPDHGQATRYAMRVSNFASQLAALRRAGVTTITLAELASFVADDDAEECPFSGPRAMITFDLHGQSLHRALAVPTILEHDFDALFFVTTGPVGTGRHANDIPWTDDLKAIAQAGMEIGSHTETHPDMRREQRDSLVASLGRTRQFLHRLTGEIPVSVAAPGGRYNDHTIDAVRRSGFSVFFTSDPCYVTRGSSPLHVCRIEIRGDNGMTALDAVTSPSKVARQATHWRLKRWLEASIGPNGFALLGHVRAKLEGY